MLRLCVNLLTKTQRIAIIKSQLDIHHIKETIQMSGVAKGMLIVLTILYLVSPIDLCPGPVDDFIILLVSLAAQKGVGAYSDDD